MVEAEGFAPQTLCLQNRIPHFPSLSGGIPPGVRSTEGLDLHRARQETVQLLKRTRHQALNQAARRDCAKSGDARSDTNWRQVRIAADFGGGVIE